MAGIVFDSSVYINALRLDDESVFSLRSYEDANGYVPVFLSAVVLEELYAGAVESRTQKLLDRFEATFESVNRFVIPSRRDWIETGKTLREIGLKFGFEQIGRGRITNDTLIATSTGRNGLKLLTRNAKDFSKIAAIKNFHWEVI